MKRRILIIEDDKDILEITAMVLKINDFEVATVSETDDIINLVNIHRPHLILTDYMLRGLTGGQICKIIKTNEDTKMIPVVLLSFYSKTAIDIGNFKFDAFVRKPLNLEYLTTVLNKHIIN
ncbi:hypothetical protein A0256_01030 [Mucilaginibacter sp. PAMC 26640]|nr:hypothetical protein A0256_01030 [Mucilaginibacter sp. PAMC 26640]